MEVHKSAAILLMVACFLILADCVSSENPFYTQKDLVFDGGLIGKWAVNTSTNKNNWDFEFRTQTKDSYLLLTKSGENKTNFNSAHLFKIQGQQFLDINWTNQLHIVWKLERSDSNLRMSALNIIWLSKLLKKDPNAIQHMIFNGNSTAILLQLRSY